MADVSQVPPRTRVASWALSGLSLACAAVIVFHGALGYFFSQDDFGWLARARGLIPRVEFPYRFLSARLYWDAMRPVGEHATPYHVVSLALHTAAAVMVLAFLRRWLASPWAWLGALFFTVHPASFTALYWISATGDILALVFALATVMAVHARGARRWLAVPCFACSLLSKESTVLLPLWIVAERWLDSNASAGAERDVDPMEIAQRAPRWRALLDPVSLALVAVSALYLAWFLGHGAAAGGDASHSASPYAMAFDRTVPLNLLTYFGWTVNCIVPTVRSFNDAVDPRVFLAGGVALALWLAGLLWKPLRDRGWLLAGLWMATFLAPVLVLKNHTYHYYLYAPLVGAGWCLGALFDAGFGPRRALATHLRVKPARVSARDTGDAARGAKPSRGRATVHVVPDASSTRGAWTLAIALGAALAVNGALLVRKIETYPFVDPLLRADPVIDRARIAHNVYESLRANPLPPGIDQLIFWSPDALSRDPIGHDPAVESYWETNVRSALYDGMGVRVLFPAVRGVEFVRTFRMVDNSSLYALYGVDGRLRLVSPAELDSVRRARTSSRP